MGGSIQVARPALGANEEQILTLREAFSAETRRGTLLAIATWMLWLVLGLVLTITSQYMARRYHAQFRLPMDAVIIGSAATLVSLPICFVAAKSRNPLAWCFVSLVLDLVVVSENKFFWLWRPPILDHVPLVLAVRYGEAQTFFVLLAIYAFPLSRRFVAWAAALGALTWTLGVVYAFASYAGSRLYWGPLGASAATLRTIMDPATLVPDLFAAEFLCICVFAAFLVIGIDQGRRFVAGRVAAQGAATFIARFFPPQLAEQIAVDSESLLRPARRSVAVMFAAGDESSLAASQERFNRIEAIVFRHGGIVDRFAGGPLMAVFGALGHDPTASALALECAREIAGANLLPISLHAGSTICGDVGGTRSRTFSVVGDTVNAARRMLDFALELGNAVIASESFLVTLPATVVTALPVAFGPVALRGRETALELRKLAL